MDREEDSGVLTSLLPSAQEGNCADIGLRFSRGVYQEVRRKRGTLVAITISHFIDPDSPATADLLTAAEI